MTGIELMERVQDVDAQDWVIIAGIVAALFFLSARFDAYIERQLDIDALGGYNAWYVVVGTSYTAVGVLVILSLVLGWWVSVVSVVMMFVVFAIALVPMIQGDMRRAGRERKRVLENASRASRQPDRTPRRDIHLTEE